MMSGEKLPLTGDFQPRDMYYMFQAATIKTSMNFLNIMQYNLLTKNEGRNLNNYLSVFQLSVSDELTELSIWKSLIKN